jgi:hypothetical protein
MAAANARVKDANYPAAAEQLAKVPAEHRRWEWAVLDRFAQAKGTPYVETRLGVGQDTLYTLRFSRNLSRVVAVDNAKPGQTEFAVLDLDTGVELFRTSAPGVTGVDDVQRTALSRDGSYLAHVIRTTQGKFVSGRLYLWDVIQRRAITKDPIILDHGVTPQAISFHPRTDEVAVGGYVLQHYAWFGVYDAKTGQQLRRMEPPGLNGGLTGFGYTPDGGELYFAYHKVMGRVTLGKKAAVTKDDCKALPGRGNGFLPLLPDKLLAWDDKVRVWGLRQKDVIGELADSADLVWPNLVVSADGKRAIGFILAKDGTVGLRAWSMADGKKTLDLPGLVRFGETINPNEGKNTKPEVVAGWRDFAVSPDGDRIVYRHDRAIRVIRIPVPD